MTVKEERAIKRKLNVINYAKKIDNVNKACNLSSTIKRNAIGDKPSFRKFSFYILKKRKLSVI